MPNGHGKCCKCGVEATHVMKYTLKSEHHRVVYVNIFADKRMMTADHILPRALGGADALSNLQLMCYKCNIDKGMIPSEQEIDRIIEDRSKHFRRSFKPRHMRFVIMHHPSLARLYGDLANDMSDGPAEQLTRITQKRGYRPDGSESHWTRTKRLSKGLVDNLHPHHPMWGWVRIFERFPELKSHVTFA